MCCQIIIFDNNPFVIFYKQLLIDRAITRVWNQSVCRIRIWYSSSLLSLPRICVLSRILGLLILKKYSLQIYMLLKAFQLVKKTTNAMRKIRLKKISLTYTSVNTSPKASARADVHMPRAELIWQHCMGSKQHFNPSSPSREDPILQAGRLAATPTPLVAAGTALVKWGARRWKRSDEQTAKRCCKKKRNKNLSRRKSTWNVTPTTKRNPSGNIGVASQVPSLLLICVSNIEITSLLWH